MRNTTFAGPRKPHCEKPNQCSFVEWVELLDYNWKVGTRSLLENDHFYPQVRHKMIEHFHYDYVIPSSCVECRRCLPALLLHHQGEVQGKPSANYKLTMWEKVAHFNPTSVRILARWYAKDIILWCNITNKNKQWKAKSLTFKLLNSPKFIFRMRLRNVQKPLRVQI